MIDELYRARGLTRVRLAALLIGDQGAAEDVAHEAFPGMYHYWLRGREPDNVLASTVTSVLATVTLFLLTWQINIVMITLSTLRLPSAFTAVFALFDLAPPLSPKNHKTTPRKDTSQKRSLKAARWIEA